MYLLGKRFLLHYTRAAFQGLPFPIQGESHDDGCAGSKL